MLVLSRKPCEKIRIGPDVTVTVLWTTANRVALGVAAPRHVAIVRDELQAEPPLCEHGHNSAGAVSKSSASS